MARVAALSVSPVVEKNMLASLLSRQIVSSASIKFLLGDV
jgi:hypothetical protein